MIKKNIDKYEEMILGFDRDLELKKITGRIREILRNDLNRRGLVVAISGGIDSSVCAALAVHAIGKDKVFGLILPERDSSSTSAYRGEMLAEHLEIEYKVQDIAPTLDAIGCYGWRDAAIKKIFPDYQENWKNKIAIKGGLEGRINHFELIVQSPGGEIKKSRMGLKEYLQVVAATNYKQRVRKTIEYFHADRLNFAVVGTPNRLEYDQGFFVKNGDGSADIKPIAHLYKSQVYEMAKYLGLPDEICSAAPTTDTYSLEQGQDEFYFALPYQEMDVALWSYNVGKSTRELAKYLKISEHGAELIYSDIEAKRRTTKYMHMPPVVIEEIKEIKY
jgi:NAD+ synthase